MTTWLVAGATGMVGSSIVRLAKKIGIDNVVEVSRQNCDLTNYEDTFNLINEHKPDVVIDAAAKVGGILANSTQPVDFLLNNLQIQNNLLKSSHENKVDKFVFLSSSCAYPKLAPQPLQEDSILTGPLEETNSAYAIAKISGMRLIQAYRQQYKYEWISVMPTNLYGYFDNFSRDNSHVVPAFIRKMHDAKFNNLKTIALWGSGSPKREFMHVDDFAKAISLLITKYDSDEPINVGVGQDLSILELANLIKKVVQFEGEIIWDKTKPDGTPRKLLDVSKIKNLGFTPKIDLEEGIRLTYKWFLEQLEKNPSILRLN
jgi:GDP-L-fucose synthase